MRRILKNEYSIAFIDKLCYNIKVRGFWQDNRASLRAVGHLLIPTDFSGDWRWCYGVCVHNAVFNYNYCDDYNHKKVTAPSSKVGSY